MADDKKPALIIVRFNRFYADITVSEVYMEEELKETKRSSKEMWLFLIFLDIIVLCVFGYFIYSSFFDGVSKSASAEPFMEEVAVEDIIVDEPVITPKALPKEEPAKAETPVAAEVKKEDPKKDEPKKEEVKKEEPKKETAKPAAKKRQSVFIRNTGKPTREVIFKYYSQAKSVAVVGGFTMRKPVKMKKLKADEWSAVMRVFPGEYRYVLLVDGKEITDPHAESKDGKSVLIVK